MLRKNIKLPKYMVHKGYAKEYPENTLDSIKEAKNRSALWVEIDIQILKDGTPVVFHDDEFNGKKIAEYLNYFDFCKQNFSLNGYSYKPPTLNQALATCFDLKLGINLDLKQSVFGYENNVIQIIRNYTFPLLLSSFYPSILENCSKINNGLFIGILFDEIPNDWKTIACQIGVDSIHANHLHLNDILIDEIKNSNYPLVAYTINIKIICDNLFQKGIDCIITDEIFD